MDQSECSISYDSVPQKNKDKCVRILEMSLPLNNMAWNIYSSSFSLHSVSELCLYAQKMIYWLNAMIIINLIIREKL